MTEEKEFRPSKIRVLWVGAGPEGSALDKWKYPGCFDTPVRIVGAEEIQSMGFPLAERMGMTMG